MRKKHSEWFAFDASFPSFKSVLGKSSGLVFFFSKIILAKIILVSLISPLEHLWVLSSARLPGTVSRRALRRRRTVWLCKILHFMKRKIDTSVTSYDMKMLCY